MEKAPSHPLWPRAAAALLEAEEWQKFRGGMSLSVLYNFCSGSRFGWEYDSPPIARGSDPGGTLRRVAS